MTRPMVAEVKLGRYAEAELGPAGGGAGCRLTNRGEPHAVKHIKLISRIRPDFDERKTAAAAGVLLVEAGRKMKYLRLIKLLYFADRKSWERFGRPITGDDYVAMKLGPVLSHTFNLIRYPAESGPWAETIETIPDHIVALKAEPNLGSLSDAEIEILKEAHSLYSTIDQWKLSKEISHALPEWKDPGRSSNPIAPEDILRALEKDDEEIEEARQEAVESAYFRGLLD